MAEENFTQQVSDGKEEAEKQYQQTVDEQRENGEATFQDMVAEQRAEAEKVFQERIEEGRAEAEKQFKEERLKGEREGERTCSEMISTACQNVTFGSDSDEFCEDFFFFTGDLERKKREGRHLYGSFYDEVMVGAGQ